MARIRYIKPGFFDNERLGSLPLAARLLFIGLWCHADRDGRLEDRPARIKKEILGYDRVDCDRLLGVLQASGFLMRYSVSDLPLLQIVNFHKHQKPHVNESASTYPAPEGYETSTVLAPESHHTNRPGKGEGGSGTGKIARSP